MHGPVNARTCPVNARVSITLGSLNLPLGVTQRCMQSGGRSKAAGLSQPGPLRHSTCPGSTYHSILAIFGPVAAGQRPEAAVEPAKQDHLELAPEV